MVKIIQLNIIVMFYDFYLLLQEPENNWLRVLFFGSFALFIFYVIELLFAIFTELLFHKKLFWSGILYFTIVYPILLWIVSSQTDLTIGVIFYLQYLILLVISLVFLYIFLVLRIYFEDLHFSKNKNKSYDPR